MPPARCRSAGIPGRCRRCRLPAHAMRAPWAPMRERSQRRPVRERSAERCPRRPQGWLRRCSCPRRSRGPWLRSTQQTEPERTTATEDWRESVPHNPRRQQAPRPQLLRFPLVRCLLRLPVLPLRFPPQRSPQSSNRSCCRPTARAHRLRRDSQLESTDCVRCCAYFLLLRVRPNGFCLSRVLSIAQWPRRSNRTPGR